MLARPAGMRAAAVGLAGSGGVLQRRPRGTSRTSAYAAPSSRDQPHVGGQRRPRGTCHTWARSVVLEGRVAGPAAAGRLPGGRAQRAGAAAAGAGPRTRSGRSRAGARQMAAARGRRARRGSGRSTARGAAQQRRGTPQRRAGVCGAAVHEGGREGGEGRRPRPARDKQTGQAAGGGVLVLVPSPPPALFAVPSLLRWIMPADWTVVWPAPRRPASRRPAAAPVL